jgi:murein DD-endopeptidase MepM/ murein hydrolase activator NlpD
MERSAGTHKVRRIYAAAVGVLAVGVVLALLAGQLREAIVDSQFRQPEHWKVPAQTQRADQPAGLAPIQEATQPISGETVTVEPAQPEIRKEETGKQQAVIIEEGGFPPHPLSGKVLQGFGWQLHPVLGDWRYHSGLDLEAPQGSAVVAVKSGQVTAVYTDPRYGLTVVIRNGPYTMMYGSLSEAVVGPGSTLRVGTRIGSVGESALEPYPHLHWAVKQEEQYVDPDRQ